MLENTGHPKKQVKQNTAKQKYPGLVSFHDTWPGNEVELFCNAPKLTRGIKMISMDCAVFYVPANTV